MTWGERPVSELLSDVASERASPAGGTVGAVVGALGASLCEMGCLHTTRAGGDADTETELRDVGDGLRTQRGHLLELADSDSEVVDELFGASGGAGPTETKRSVGVPFTIARACLTVLELGVVVLEEGSRTVLADVGAGVRFAHAAFQASAFVVRSNLGQVRDCSFVDTMERRTVTTEESAERTFERAKSALERRA